MKNVVGILMAIFFVAPAMAAELVNSCEADIKVQREEGTVKLEIFASKSYALSAKVTSSAGGQTASYEDEAQIIEEKIRAGLTAESNIDQASMAEKLIIHAMMMTETPEMKDVFSAGLDLKAVRSARVYIVGKTTKFGMSAIIEAFDENDNRLGQFLGGFVVAPCK